MAVKKVAAMARMAKTKALPCSAKTCVVHSTTWQGEEGRSHLYTHGTPDEKRKGDNETTGLCLCLCLLTYDGC